MKGDRILNTDIAHRYTLCLLVNRFAQCGTGKYILSHIKK